jgi:hypothetical protein
MKGSLIEIKRLSGNCFDRRKRFRQLVRYHKNLNVVLITPLKCFKGIKYFEANKSRSWAVFSHK